MLTICGHHIITDGCKHCRALQTQWYKTLEEKDFHDAESITREDRPLKVWHKNRLELHSSDEIQNTHEYYEKCLELLHTFKFENETIERIWSLHCDGLSRHKIEIAIANMPVSYSQSKIRFIIIDLEREIDW